MQDAFDSQSTPRVPGGPGAAASIQSDDLFNGAREIVIEHNGEFYRLRITRHGKLILNK